MKLGIVIATYQRKDGSTPKYLTRALDSIFNQTYQDFKIYLIGDRYENEEEINDIVSNDIGNNFYFENLKVAKERDFYTDNRLLWSYGGVNAINHGINLALSEGIEFICHLDHDDWWLKNHLEEVYNCIIKNNAHWVCTKSTYGNSNKFLPKVDIDEKYIPFLPKSSRLIHSSVCINFKKIPLFYRDVFEETGKIGLPADADLWERSRVFIEENKLNSVFVNVLTCRHDEEVYEKSKK